MWYCTGLRLLCSIFEQPNSKLHTVFLGNNKTIGNEVMEELFIAINKGNNITTLNLSNCGISTCEWSSYLPFLSTLETLSISYNCIDDSEFVKLCKGLEKCRSIKHLDLAHNKFVGLKCNVIEHLLGSNKALVTLSLCGNRCVDSVWDAIHRGLLKNDTLLSLDLSECNITLPNATILYQALAVNELCTLNMINNPLPDSVICDPRAYFSQHSQTHEAQQLTEHAHRLNAARSREWSAAREKEVVLSLHTLSIVTEDGGRSAITAARAAAAATASPHALADPALIVQSEHYIAPTALREIVAQSDLANTSEARELHVAYGRAPLLIGAIHITSLTTYAEAHALVRPLVKEYVQTIAPTNPTVHETLVSNYALMDAQGRTLAPDEMRVRNSCFCIVQFY